MGPRTGWTMGMLMLAAGFLSGCAQIVPVDTAAQVAVPDVLAPAAMQNLVGSSAATLNAELGPPELRRIDGTSQVWLYHSPVCGLNLILFPDSAGVPRVATAVPDRADEGTCMASLQRQTASLERPAAS